MTRDYQYEKDKKDAKKEAREEYLQHALSAFIDRVVGWVLIPREEVVDIIEKLITKKRRWL